MAQLRHIKASETFTALLTYPVSTPGQFVTEKQTTEQIDMDRRIAVLKALGCTVQASDLPRIEQDSRVKNQLAVLQALQCLKDAGALTFPTERAVVRTIFRFHGAAGSN
jgi:hypothetical protein